MIRVFRRTRNFFTPSAALLAAALLIPCMAQATPTTPYVVTFYQQGNNVVAKGSGEFDLSGLSLYISGTPDNAVQPDKGYVGTGSPNFWDGYTGKAFSGPMSFGSGGRSSANSGTGDDVALAGTSFPYRAPAVFVPSGYLSGTALSNTSTWNNATFASLGMDVGTYIWTWGSAPDQTFTLKIGGTLAVPEPAALGMFGLGVLLIGGFVSLRRRVASEL